MLKTEPWLSLDSMISALKYSILRFVLALRYSLAAAWYICLCTARLELFLVSLSLRRSRLMALSVLLNHLHSGLTVTVIVRSGPWLSSMLVEILS